MSEQNDLTQIGLTIKSKQTLERLKNDNYFADMRDAYKFAIALALARDIQPPELPPGRQTMYATPTVDSDGSLRSAILALMPSNLPPYRWAERLAEAGVEILADLADSGRLDPVAIIAEAKAPTRS